MDELLDEREEELETLAAIYPELALDPEEKYSTSLELPVAPVKPLYIRFDRSPLEGRQTKAARDSAASIERDIAFSHLPPLKIHLTLPDGYPTIFPPNVHLSTEYDWLPQSKRTELERDLRLLWKEYGCCQILFTYIDHLQQAIDRGFDLDPSEWGGASMSTTIEKNLVDYDKRTKQTTFDAGTYDCGICLEPKKGSDCYQLQKCGHVFCRQCLQDFFNNAITEGDVVGVKCLAPDCGKSDSKSSRKSSRKESSLHPRELLAMGIEERMVRRYVEMKRKKKMDADKNMIYCPRTWCQGAAKSDKYPPIPKDLSAYIESESMSENDESDDNRAADEQYRTPQAKKSNVKIPADPSERVAVCEKCSFAFCKVCYMGWHGPYARCHPRDPSELSAEEKASYDYILANTSACPYCNSPTQKTMGCNHMICFNCQTHYCYLCGFWLSPKNPYVHFNSRGPCHGRLWELEAGDEGEAPADGAGFAGARGWEQQALEAAREAETEEVAAIARAEEEDRVARLLAEANAPVDDPQDALVVEMAQVVLNDEEANQYQQLQQQPNQAGRRQRNPFPRPPAQGAANAVRNHERNRGGGVRGGVPRHRGEGDGERQHQQLVRFLQMAELDEEDGWDSDELGEDDDGFVIR